LKQYVPQHPDILTCSPFWSFWVRMSVRRPTILSFLWLSTVPPEKFLECKSFQTVKSSRKGSDIPSRRFPESAVTGELSASCVVWPGPYSKPHTNSFCRVMGSNIIRIFFIITGVCSVSLYNHLTLDTKKKLRVNYTTLRLKEEASYTSLAAD
jgi:hypothetical protein